MPTHSTKTRKPKNAKPRQRGPNERIQKSERFYSRLETAKEFGVTPSTIGKWEKEGKLIPYKFGYRILRYEKSEVDRLVKEGRGAK